MEIKVVIKAPKIAVWGACGKYFLRYKYCGYQCLVK